MLKVQEIRIYIFSTQNEISSEISHNKMRKTPLRYFTVASLIELLDG